MRPQRLREVSIYCLDLKCEWTELGGSDQVARRKRWCSEEARMVRWLGRQMNRGEAGLVFWMIRLKGAV